MKRTDNGKITFEQITEPMAYMIAVFLKRISYFPIKFSVALRMTSGRRLVQNVEFLGPFSVNIPLIDISPGANIAK